MLGAIGKKHDRQIINLRPKGIQKSLAFRIVDGALNIDPLLRIVIARQEIAELVRAGDQRVPKTRIPSNGRRHEACQSSSRSSSWG